MWPEYAHLNRFGVYVYFSSPLQTASAVVSHPASLVANVRIVIEPEPEHGGRASARSRQANWFAANATDQKPVTAIGFAQVCKPVPTTGSRHRAAATGDKCLGVCVCVCEHASEH